MKNNFNVLTLAELIRAKECGEIPDNVVVVTFDDGYRDFFDIAFPILQEEGVPATLFLTTGFVSGDTWLWPDMLKYALSKTNLTSLVIDGEEHAITHDSDKHELWNLLADRCLQISDDEKNELIGKVFSAAGVERPVTAPPGFEALTWGQVNEMVKHGLDIGSHSVNHPVLTRLSEQRLAMELTESKRVIQQKTDIYTEVFCYPNGTPEDYNDHIKSMMEKAGYCYGVVAFPGVNPLKCAWTLNRYPVNDDMNFFEKSVFGLTYLGMSDR